MFKNYFVVALRNIRRERVYAFINIAGLAIGLTICLLVTAYIADEWSFDRFHAERDRLYRVNLVNTRDGDGNVTYSAGTPFPLRELIRDNVPEVEGIVQLTSPEEVVVTVNGNSYRESVVFADREFFEIFSFPLRDGDANSVMTDPSGVVISASLADRFFGKADALGKQLTLTRNGKSQDYKIDGVAVDAPTNSSITFEIIVPKSEAAEYSYFELGWNFTWAETFLFLSANASVERVTANLADAAATIPRETESQMDWQFALQPIIDLHLNTEIDGTTGVSSPVYSYLLGAIGLVVLTLACINFTTLAIGRSQRRVREIGVRKTMGASAKQLWMQLLGEAGLFTFLALLAAYAMAELLLPTFNDLAAKQIPSIMQSAGIWLPAMMGLLLITSLFAGGYPALVLTRAKTVEAVRGKAVMLAGGALTRVLVALQFTLSAALIVITLTMSRQLAYVQNAPLGFNKEQLVLVSLRGTGPEEIMTVVQRIRNSLTASDGVVSVCASSTDFTGSGWRNGVKAGPDSIDFTVFLNAVDYEYCRTMGIELVSGAGFDANISKGTSKVLVNETFVKKLGWDDPLGKEVPGIGETEIVGMVKDYHLRPLAEKIEPVALIQTGIGLSWAEPVRYVLVRIMPDNLPHTMQRIQETFKQVAPDLPYSYEFMDEHIAAQYGQYQRWEHIVRAAAFFAVIVAGFGVFGLTALAVARRRKELGIRKVLGAQSSQLVTLLNRDFVTLAIIGGLFAVPLAYWSVNTWLEGFAYRAAVSPWTFVAGLLLLVCIVVITASSQAIRAAQMAPVDAIRYE